MGQLAQEKGQSDRGGRLKKRDTLSDVQTDEQKAIEQIRDTVGTLIVWTAQSANSPLSVTEAQHLLKMLGKWTRGDK